MKEVYIAKSVIVTGIGDTVEENWGRLIEGRSAIGTIHHFDTGRLHYHQAACVADLRRKHTENHICVLMQRVLDRIKPVPPKTFIIWTGIKGNAEYIESGQKKDMLHLPAQYRQWVADHSSIANNGIEINAACAASTVGLALGAQKIALGEYDSVLVCAADLVTRFVHTGFSALKALTATTCRPFDRRRDGMCLGDGAVAIQLTGSDTARKAGSKNPVRISGWGISNDATHITGPARDGRGLASAIQTALRMAGIYPDGVEAYCAHGTGTVYNDSMELTAIENVFGPRRFPVFSIKGAVGHTLGAAGGIETAICCQALEKKSVPPTIGMENPEKEAMGRVSNTAQSFGGQNILTTNSGFGGVNAAILLQAEEFDYDSGQ